MLQEMDKTFCSTRPHVAFVTTTSEDGDKDEDEAIPREDNEGFKQEAIRQIRKDNAVH